MDLITGIKERRSVRRFADKPVPRELITEIVEIARYAPSWKNTQTARYIVVDDPEKKAQLLELLSALRVRRYFKQPESDFPPGLTLRVGEYARVEVFDPSNGIVAYYTVSLIQPPLGTFTNLSTQARWRLQDNEAVAAVAAYIRQLTE